MELDQIQKGIKFVLKLLYKIVIKVIVLMLIYVHYVMKSIIYKMVSVFQW